jgi:hypothetical protein
MGMVLTSDDVSASTSSTSGVPWACTSSMLASSSFDEAAAFERVARVFEFESDMVFSKN